MSLIFWLLLIVDVLFAILIISLQGLRQNFGAHTNLNSWLLIVLILIIIASLVFRFSLKMPRVAILIAALPVLGMFIWYLFDRNQ